MERLTCQSSDCSFQIYEHDRNYGRYCEQSVVPMITSTSSLLLVEFVSKFFSATTPTGFNATYSFVDGKRHLHVLQKCFKRFIFHT